MMYYNDGYNLKKIITIKIEYLLYYTKYKGDDNCDI